MISEGNFPTVVSPNPEARRPLELGIAQAKRMDADIVFGADPILIVWTLPSRWLTEIWRRFLP